METAPNNPVFLDPTTLTEDDLPVIVLDNDTSTFLGWAIRDNTSGNYNHAFIIHKPGLAVSQDFGLFREKKLTDYMKTTHKLKFWRTIALTPDDKDIILSAIQRRLTFPWWRKTYDFLGIFGQFIRVKWIQSPWQEFCSEQVNDDYIKPISRTAKMNIVEPNPGELDWYFVNNLDVMECLGYFLMD